MNQPRERTPEEKLPLGQLSDEERLAVISKAFEESFRKMGERFQQEAPARRWSSSNGWQREACS